jgi:threonine synthase
MNMLPVEPSLSPSMDIQVSSNFERLLFDLLDQDGDAVTETLLSFRKSGVFTLAPDRLQRVRRLFDGFRLDDEATLAEIARVYRMTGEVIDPHSAIGIAAARARRREDVPVMVAMATAHPAKFPDAVERACGVRPELPDALSDLYEREERLINLPNDLNQLMSYVESNRWPSNKGSAVAAERSA